MKYQLVASWSLVYLYTKKYPLSWSQTMYGIYTGYTLLLQGIAAFLIGPLLQKRIGMSDITVIMFSMFMTGMGEVLFSFCTKTWMVFIGYVIGAYLYYM